MHTTYKTLFQTPDRSSCGTFAVTVGKSISDLDTEAQAKPRSKSQGEELPFFLPFGTVNTCLS